MLILTADLDLGALTLARFGNAQSAGLSAQGGEICPSSGYRRCRVGNALNTPPERGAPPARLWQIHPAAHKNRLIC
jgi:hypothetical protein